MNITTTSDKGEPHILANLNTYCSTPAVGNSQPHNDQPRYQVIGARKSGLKQKQPWFAAANSHEAPDTVIIALDSSVDPQELASRFSLDFYAQYNQSKGKLKDIYIITDTQSLPPLNTASRELIDQVDAFPQKFADFLHQTGFNVRVHAPSVKQAVIELMNDQEQAEKRKSINVVRTTFSIENAQYSIANDHGKTIRPTIGSLRVFLSNTKIEKDIDDSEEVLHNSISEHHELKADLAKIKSQRVEVTPQNQTVDLISFLNHPSNTYTAKGQEQLKISISTQHPTLFNLKLTIEQIFQEEIHRLNREQKNESGIMSVSKGITHLTTNIKPLRDDKIDYLKMLQKITIDSPFIMNWRQRFANEIQKISSSTRIKRRSPLEAKQKIVLQHCINEIDTALNIFRKSPVATKKLQPPLSTTNRAQKRTVSQVSSESKDNNDHIVITNNVGFETEKLIAELDSFNKNCAPNEKTKEQFMARLHTRIKNFNLDELKFLLKLMFSVQAHNKDLYPDEKFSSDFFKKSCAAFDFVRTRTGMGKVFSSHGNTSSWKKTCHLVKEAIMDHLKKIHTSGLLPSDIYFDVKNLLSIRTGVIFNGTKAIDTTSVEKFQHDFSILRREEVLDHTHSHFYKIG